VLGHSLQDAPRFERQVRAALVHIHDVAFLQTNPIGGLAGRALRAALLEAVAALKTRVIDDAAGRLQRLLELRYVEAAPSHEVAKELGVSMAEYYRAHGGALRALASLLGALAATPSRPSRQDAAASLPRRIDRLVGREREIAEVCGLLGEAPLLTLVGPGGVGKTRLALEAARGAGQVGRDGVWMVELAGLADSGLVPSAVTAAVGAPPAQDPLIGTQRLARGAERASRSRPAS